MTKDAQKLNKVLAELKAEYLISLPQKIGHLRKLTMASDWNELSTALHNLKGTGKTYGYPEVSTICRIGEDLANDPKFHDKNIFLMIPDLLEKVCLCYEKSQKVDLKTHSSFISLQRYHTNRKN